MNYKVKNLRKAFATYATRTGLKSKFLVKFAPFESVKTQPKGKIEKKK
jgi:hypothetical protein